MIIDTTGCQGVWAETILEGVLWCDVHDRQVNDWNGCEDETPCNIRVLGGGTQ